MFFGILAFIAVFLLLLRFRNSSPKREPVEKWIKLTTLPAADALDDLIRNLEDANIAYRLEYLKTKDDGPLHSNVVQMQAVLGTAEVYVTKADTTMAHKILNGNRDKIETPSP